MNDARFKNSHNSAIPTIIGNAVARSWELFLWNDSFVVFFLFRTYSNSKPFRIESARSNTMENRNRKENPKECQKNNRMKESKDETERQERIGGKEVEKRERESKNNNSIVYARRHQGTKARRWNVYVNQQRHRFNMDKFLYGQAIA